MKKIIPILFVSGILLGPINGISQSNCATCGKAAITNPGNHGVRAKNSHIKKLENSPNKFAPTIVNSLNSATTYAALGVCGLNWTSAHVMTQTRSTIVPTNTNGTGFPTTLTIAGIPANCYQIEAAYLYYTASYTEATAPVTTASFTNPALVNTVLPSTLVATGPSVGWGETGTAEYRVDVTANIAGNGNYAVDLNGFANVAWEVDGCTLIIVYIAGPTNSTTGTFALWDGDWVQNSSNTTYDDIMSFPAPCTNTTAQAFLQISDDQANVTATHTDLFNGTPSTFANDFYSFDLANVALTTASTTITEEPYTNWVQGSSYDLWEWTLVGMYWQNTGCTNCLPAIVTTPIDPLCNGGLGSANAAVTGGTPPYTYTWSDGQTTSTATGLAPATYTINVEDVICNTAQATVTITQPPLLNATANNMIQASCGGNNGSASVTANGGTGPYQYLWTPSNQTNITATGLSAGSYTVTVTDANGCTATSSIVVTSTSNIIATMGPQTNILCNGGTASATVTVAGGNGPYTYAWVPNGGAGATGTGLTAGSYTVNVTDNNGCTASATIIITQPPPMNIIISAQTNELCSGGNSGSATITVNGGAGPYTYAWVPNGGNGPTGTGLTAGSYTVNVTDNNGCTNSAIVLITEPPAVTASATTTQTGCAVNSGTATVLPGGGTPNYTYVWTPGGQTNITATGLSAGIYTVTVTDANGCTQTTTATVTAAGGETVSISASTNITCNGANNGTATATVVGGTGPYTYAWTPNGGSTANATGLSAGLYTITVTDANGCISIATVNITQPNPLTASITATTNIKCNGLNNGSFTVTAGGGTPNYSYNWTPNGGSTANATGLSAGNYTVTVTDANGCTATASGTITEPLVLAANVSATVNVSCAGGTNGGLAVNVTGGTTAYTYAWTPSGGNASIASGLSAGTYTISVTDANGCTASATGTVTQPLALTCAVSSTTNITCFGKDDGSITVAPAGGTTPYTYTWTPNVSTLSSATGLSAGTYTVVVTDANLCSATTTATIVQPPLLSVTASGPSDLCSGQTATLSCIPAGGTAPYNYAWSTGSSTSTASTIVLTTTTYTITITDANGCTASTTVTVTTSPALTIAITGGYSLCLGSSTTLIATASGGTGSYTYIWQPNNSSGQSIVVTPAVTTTYTVMATDGCSNVTSTITVYVNPSPKVSFTAFPSTGCSPLCVQLRDLSTLSNGNILSWKWNFGDGDSITERDPIHCYYKTGNYSVDLTVTSDSGCSSTLKILNLVTVYPSPIANFTYTPNPVTIVDPLVQFTDISSSSYPIVYWNWNFRDGSPTDATSTLQDPTHQYGDTGTYCATLTVMDEHGCVDSITDCLVVNPLFTLYIPDAFSPNGDGVNDLFMAKGSYIKNFEMYIYDRWGMKLFYANDIMKGWDGTVNGGSNIAQEDTYVYLINVTDTQGNKHSYNGKVTLIK